MYTYISCLFCIFVYFIYCIYLFFMYIYIFCIFCIIVYFVYFVHRVPWSRSLIYLWSPSSFDVTAGGTHLVCVCAPSCTLVATIVTCWEQTIIGPIVPSSAEFNKRTLFGWDWMPWMARCRTASTTDTPVNKGPQEWVKGDGNGDQTKEVCINTIKAKLQGEAPNQKSIWKTLRWISLLFEALVNKHWNSWTIVWNKKKNEIRRRPLTNQFK